MTITTETSRSSHAGAGGTGPFATGFKFLADADLLLIKQVDATLVSTILVNVTDYTIPAGGAGAASGADITTIANVAVGETLWIINDPTRTQLANFVSGGVFPAETHEEALDRVTLVAQRAVDIASRAPLLDDGDTPGSGVFQAGGQKIADVATPTVASDAATKAYVDNLIGLPVTTPISDIDVDAAADIAATKLADLGNAATRDPAGAAATTIADEIQELRFQIEAIVNVLNNGGGTWETAVPAQPTFGSGLVIPAAQVIQVPPGANTHYDGTNNLDVFNIANRLADMTTAAGSGIDYDPWLPKDMQVEETADGNTLVTGSYVTAGSVTSLDTTGRRADSRVLVLARCSLALNNTGQASFGISDQGGLDPLVVNRGYFDDTAGASAQVPILQIAYFTNVTAGGTRTFPFRVQIDSGAATRLDWYNLTMYLLDFGPAT